MHIASHSETILFLPNEDIASHCALSDIDDCYFSGNECTNSIRDIIVQL